MREIIPRVAKLAELLRRVGCAVIHTREGYAPDLSDVHTAKASRRSSSASSWDNEIMLGPRLTRLAELRRSAHFALC